MCTMFTNTLLIIKFLGFMSAAAATTLRRLDWPYPTLDSYLTLERVWDTIKCAYSILAEDFPAATQRK